MADRHDDVWHPAAARSAGSTLHCARRDAQGDAVRAGTESMERVVCCCASCRGRRVPVPTPERAIACCCWT